MTTGENRITGISSLTTKKGTKKEPIKENERKEIPSHTVFDLNFQLPLILKFFEPDKTSEDEKFTSHTNISCSSHVTPPYPTRVKVMDLVFPDVQRKKGKEHQQINQQSCHTPLPCLLGHLCSSNVQALTRPDQAHYWAGRNPKLGIYIFFFKSNIQNPKSYDEFEAYSQQKNQIS